MICDFSGFLHNIYIVGRRDLFMEKWIFVVGVLLMMNGVLADISISEPSAVYNLGDRLYIDLGGLRGANNGNLDINLVCENVTINMIRIPAAPGLRRPETNF